MRIEGSAGCLALIRPTMSVKGGGKNTGGYQGNACQVGQPEAATLACKHTYCLETLGDWRCV
eukprot:1161606-Pelagomonas_calceolata.AAC.15